MDATIDNALQRILDQFRDDTGGGEADAGNKRDPGDWFERLMQEFFRVDPLYAELFFEVWMGNQWPKNRQVASVAVAL